MNIGRGFFRMWIVLSGVWIVFCFFTFDFSCFFGSYPRCDRWSLFPLSTSIYARTLGATLGVPAIAFIFGLGVLWIIKVFQRDHAAN